MDRAQLEVAMRLALGQAEDALDHEDVPIGAVLLDAAGTVVAADHNRREQLNDPTAHAEILALRAAAARVGDWRLDGCTLYVTLEPCAMCAGALVLARIDRLVYAAADPKAGMCGSLGNIPQDDRLNHHVSVVGGLLADAAGDLLREFFRERR